MTLLTGCNSPTVKDPVDSCIINTSLDTARCGKRDLNYKTKQRDQVAEWITPENNFNRRINELDNYVCFSLEAWLIQIKPILKKGHDYYYDNN